MPAVLNGLFATEAAAAGLEDLGEHDGHRILRVRGKGETETNQLVPLNAPTVAALEAWLAERARIAGATAIADSQPRSPCGPHEMASSFKFPTSQRLVRWPRSSAPSNGA